MKQTLRVSVRELVEYALRSGDLNLTFFSSESPVKAIRAHQTLQDSRPEQYTAEVVVHHLYKTKKYDLDISGRIDGVYIYPDRVIIEEIKTTKKPLAEIEKVENGMHWGQAKCYAYIYATQNDLDNIEVQLTYYQIEQEKAVEIRRSFDLSELRDFFESLISKYIAWADTIVRWMELRDSSIDELKFPFDDCRPGQNEMMEETAGAIAGRTQLLIQAPTGIGKTMAVVFPAVQATAQGQVRKVFYLTARTTGRNAAESTFDILRKNGLRFKSLSLTAKDKLCFNTDKMCNGEDCKYARGYYDRITEAINDA
ncbi:PD-(D/E)XK nuclease family protein, partial [candidate division WOR-3 bacterium]|nr:PD-(D/E)XK nuclease family protein [candidate division WOR-3 bacterium]